LIILVPKIEPIIPIIPFERVDISSSVIEVKPYSKEMITISGDISEDEFLQGVRVYIILKKPDGSTETLKIVPARKSGHFETTVIFDNDSMRGFYEVWAIYLDQRDRDMDVVFEVVTAGKQTTTTTLEAFRQDSAPKEIEKSTTVEPESFDDELNIPDWIKNNARWWSEGAIADNDFTSGIQFMIKENIMVISDLPEEVTQMELKDEKRAMGLERDKNVPDWVRSNAGWWADGLISDDDFISGIKYLVEQGIIQVS